MEAWSFRALSSLRKLLGDANSAQGQGQNGSSHKRGKSDRASWTRGMLPVCGLGAAAGLALAPALYQQEKKHLAALEEVGTGPSYHPAASLPFASINSLTLAVAAEPTSEEVAVEPVTGLEFPKLISTQKPCCRGKGPFKGLTLSGLGVRSKRLLGLANIRVYAFGVYVDSEALKKELGQKYKGLPEGVIKASKWLMDDVMESDCPVTVRLVISYKGLKIGQVRGAFNESLGGALKAISGKPEPALLDSFTSQFTDNIDLHRGTIIDLKKGPGYVMSTEFDGKSTGSVKSSTLCWALLSLYLGDKPFDQGAADSVKGKFASILSS